MVSRGTASNTSTTAPHWPPLTAPPEGSPNILVVVFDDVGFSDFGCYGSPIDTPTLDGFAANGAQFTGFHTTAMCSTTRASLLTGRNHHSVGMGCLANFDSGYEGYRGKIARDAPTIAELLAQHGYRNYMVGKWHVNPLTESGPTGPFDGWPLGRGFHRFYGFLDAETDHYAPELVMDNSHVAAPGTYESGYHLTSDLVDKAMEFIASHEAVLPGVPWLTWLAFGACHAPHQAPRELIDHYDRVFADGWDAERDRRLASQIDRGVVPADTRLPPRNDHVGAWADHNDDERRVFTRLQAAYAAMLDHADQQLARLADHLERSGQLDDTIVVVLSDNGASQEGGPLGFVNAMGPYNGIPEPVDRKLARLDDIGGPDTHSNYPWGWAMAANTPLRRYKQNTHGGGIRDPLVLRWPAGGVEPGLRRQFCHASDLLPTLLDLAQLDHPQGIEGTSFAATLNDADATTDKRVQYFEMFGHRGIWKDGWKAVAYHPPGTAFEDDQWELFDLASDFNEVQDCATQDPEKLQQLIDEWWTQAEQHKVLPLDDRFAERFAENAERHHGSRQSFVFHAGMGHLPADVAPDLRSRSYDIVASVEPLATGTTGVLVAHGDAASGYSLYIDGSGHLVHDLNIGGSHQLVRSPHPVPEGATKLGFHMRRHGGGGGTGSLSIDGQAVAEMTTPNIFALMISWSGLDIGLDRGSPVSAYATPFEFSGRLLRVDVDLAPDQDVDHDGAGRAEMARE